jgi:hypothetical protein
VSDREDRGTGELPPTEPTGRTGTEPLRPPVVPSGNRRPGIAIPGSLLLIAAGILVLGLVLGFFVGRATAPDEPSEQTAVEQGGGRGQGQGQGQGQGGGGGQRRERRQACREALSLSQQLVGAQNELLANRGQLAEAVAAGDATQIEELNAQADQLLARVASLQGDLEGQIQRCL